MSKKKIAIVGILLVCVVVAYYVDSFANEIREEQLIQETLGKDRGTDGSGNRCAMSQMVISSQYPRGNCDYSKPVIDLKDLGVQP